MTVIEKLISISAEPWRELDTILSPEWENREKVHDWRNHVTYDLRQMWAELSEEARVAVFVAAAEDASNENWD